MSPLHLHTVLESLSNARAQQFSVDFKGLALASHFQPIYSVSHSRVVGHEALLRAHDAEGHAVPPTEVFQRCEEDGDADWCDTLSRGLHVHNFVAQEHDDNWLFLNIRPEALLDMTQDDTGAHLVSVLAKLDLPFNSVVLELLESEIPSGQAFLDAVEKARARGVLIALDDFGAGHSNFDRVWSIRPDIVKLDRSLVTGMAGDVERQRVVSQMVSLLHECNALVLMEGIETEEEALLALEADVDFVQGFYFCRPQPELRTNANEPKLKALHGKLARFRQEQRRHQKDLIAPYQNAVGYATILLSAGRSHDDAFSGFMTLPGTDLCYVLDENGFQVGNNVWSAQGLIHSGIGFGPMSRSEGACWARRPYFKRALQNPGKVQVTRPYRSLNGTGMTVTVSCAYLVKTGNQSHWYVACGDLSWDNGPLIKSIA